MSAGPPTKVDDSEIIDDDSIEDVPPVPVVTPPAAPAPAIASPPAPSPSPSPSSLPSAASDLALPGLSMPAALKTKLDEAERVRRAEEEIARMSAEQAAQASEPVLTAKPLSVLDDVEGFVDKSVQHETLEALAPAMPGPGSQDGEEKAPRELALSLVDVAKSYFKGNLEVRVLDGLFLEVPQGSFEALMGPSGSGKSTLLHLIAGLDRPTAGSIRVAGADLGSMSEEQLSHWRARTIGFIFQHYNLLPALTAAQNVELPLLLRTELTKAQRAERVRIALKVVGLEDRLHYKPRELSGGQEQRVAIARAIVTDPKILICDEPTGDLDRKSADAVLDLLGELNRQFSKTIFMVTHDPEAASRATSKRVLSKGRLA